MNKMGCRISTVLLVGWCVGFASSAAAADERSAANATCRQETKRVVVWPPGPKAAPTARFENREVRVCDAKVAQQSGKGK